MFINKCQQEIVRCALTFFIYVIFHTLNYTILFERSDEMFLFQTLFHQHFYGDKSDKCLEPDKENLISFLKLRLRSKAHKSSPLTT